MNRTDQILRDKLGSHKSPLPAGDWQDMRAIYVSAYYKKVQRVSAIFIVASLAAMALCFGLTSPKNENPGTAMLPSSPEHAEQNIIRLNEAAEKPISEVKQQITDKQETPGLKAVGTTKSTKLQFAFASPEKAKEETVTAAAAGLYKTNPLNLQALGWKTSAILGPELIKDLPYTPSYPDGKLRFRPFISYSYGLGGIKQKYTGNLSAPIEFEKGNFFVETLSAEVGLIAGKEKSAFQYQIGLAITDQKIRGNYYLPAINSFSESTVVARNNSPELFSSYTLSLPISVTCLSPLEIGGITTFVHAGAEPAYAFNQKGVTPKANGHVAPAAPGDFNSFSFSWKAGAGIGYSLNKRLDAKLIYHYNEQLTSFYSNSGVVLKPYRHTISLLFELKK